MELNIQRTQLDKMGHSISGKDFMLHILNNLPTKYESKVESLEKELDNKDDRLTLDQMTAEVDIEYEKICKTNDYDPESGIQNKKKIIIKTAPL